MIDIPFGVWMRFAAHLINIAASPFTVEETAAILRLDHEVTELPVLNKRVFEIVATKGYFAGATFRHYVPVA